jgi:hypothetical protein
MKIFVNCHFLSRFLFSHQFMLSQNILEADQIYAVKLLHRKP